MKIQSLLNPYFNEHRQFVYQKPMPLLQHYVHHKESLLDYICSKGFCPECHQGFVSKGSAFRHYYCVHSKALPCPYCHKSIKYLARMDLLKQHLIRCQPNLTLTTCQLRTIYLSALKANNIQPPTKNKFYCT